MAQSHHQKKYKGFTLLEIIIAAVLFFSLVAVSLSLYRNFFQVKRDIEIKQLLVQNSYKIVEQINQFFKDYTIDYEEYFNRSIVWCDKINPSFFSWNVMFIEKDWSCDVFSSYGNFNNFSSDTNRHQLYYCSSIGPSQISPQQVNENPTVLSWDGCVTASMNTWWQSFGQYALQFLDVADDADGEAWSVWDDDDALIWNWPMATILWQSGAQELYLISQDKKQRVFLRRKLIESWDRNWDWIVWNSPVDNLYALQILKLKSFDAWDNHDFSLTNSSGVYDWQIDTWACDFWQWFICNWNSIGWLFSGYRLPVNGDDGWVSFFNWDITISSRSISLSPLKDPLLANNHQESQIQPFLTVIITFHPYWKKLWKQFLWGLINQNITLQTSFRVKSQY